MVCESPMNCKAGNLLKGNAENREISLPNIGKKLHRDSFMRWRVTPGGLQAHFKYIARARKQPEDKISQYSSIIQETYND